MVSFAALLGETINFTQHAVRVRLVNHVVFHPARQLNVATVCVQSDGILTGGSSAVWMSLEPFWSLAGFVALLQW
jgi:hypothetical protein